MSFRIKENPDGSFKIFKARLVAKGFHKIHGLGFHETFSPVVKPITIRLILTIALTHKLTTQKVDVNNAFLNGTLTKEAYMEQPKGLISSNPSHVFKLNKSLYGLKKAPRHRFEKLQTSLLHLKFQASKM